MKKNKFLNRILAFSLATIMAISSTSMVANAATSHSSGTVISYPGNGNRYATGGSCTSSMQPRWMAALPVITVTPLSNLNKATVDENNLVINLDSNFTPSTVKDVNLLKYIVPHYADCDSYDDVDLVGRIYTATTSWMKDYGYTFSADYLDEFKTSLSRTIAYHEVSSGTYSDEYDSFAMVGNLKPEEDSYYGLQAYKHKYTKTYEDEQGISTEKTDAQVESIINDSNLKEGVQNYDKLLKALSKYAGTGSIYTQFRDRLKFIQTPLGNTRNYYLKNNAIGWYQTPLCTNTNAIEFNGYVYKSLKSLFDNTTALHSDVTELSDSSSIKQEFNDFITALGLPEDEPLFITVTTINVVVMDKWNSNHKFGDGTSGYPFNSYNREICVTESYSLNNTSLDTKNLDLDNYTVEYTIAALAPTYCYGERIDYNKINPYNSSDTDHADYFNRVGNNYIKSIGNLDGYKGKNNTYVTQTEDSSYSSYYKSVTYMGNDRICEMKNGTVRDSDRQYLSIDVRWDKTDTINDLGEKWVIGAIDNNTGSDNAHRGMLIAMVNTVPGGKKVVAQKNAEVSFSQYNYSDYVTKGNLNKNYVWTPAENSTSVTTVTDVDNNVVKAGKADYQGSGLQVGQTLPANKSTTVKVINGDILTLNKDELVKYEASKDNNANKNAFETKYTAPTVSSGYKLGLSTYMSDYIDVNMTVKGTYEDVVKNQQVGVKLKNDTLTGEKQVGSVITVNDVPFFTQNDRSKITAGSYSHLAKQNGLLVHTIGTDFSYYSYRTSASYYTSGGKAYKKDNNDIKVATYVNLKDKEYQGVASMQLFTDANTKLAAKSINGATALLFSFPFTSGAKMKYNPEKGDKLATIEATSDKPQRLLTNYNVFVKLPKVHSELYVVDTQLTVGEGGKCTIHLGTPEYKSKTEDYLISKDPNDDDAKNRIELPEDTMGYIAVPLAWFRNNQDVFSAATVEITSLKSNYIGSLLTKIAGSVNKPQEYIAESGEMGNEDIFVGASAYTSGGFAVIAIMGITDVTITTNSELLSYQINRIYPDLVWSQLGAEHFFNTKTDEKNIYKFKSESRDCYMLQSTYCAQGYYNKQVKDATINAYKDVVESSNATYHQKITGYRSDADKAKYLIYSKGYEITKPVYNELGQKTGTIKAWVGGNFNTYDKIEGINFNTVWKGAANNSQSWSAKSGDSYRYGVGVFTYGLNLTRKDFDDVKTISTLTTNGGVGNTDVLAKVVDYAGGGQDNKPSDKYLKITTYNLPTAQVSKTNYSKIDWSGDLDSYNNDGHKRVKDTKKPSNCTYNLNGMPVKFNSTTITHTVPATATTQATTHQHTHYYDGRYANVPNAPTPAFTTPDSYIYKWVYYNGYNFMNILDKGTDIHRVLTVSILEGGIKGAHLEINEKAFKYMPDDKGVKDSTKSDEMLKNTLGDTSNVNGTLMFRDAKIDNVTLKYYPEVLMRWYVNTNSAENVLTKQDDVTYGSVKVMGDVKRQSTSSGLYIYSVNDGYNNADIIDYGNSKTINKLTNDKKVSGVTVSSGYQTSQDTSGLPIMYAGSDVTLNVEAQFTINLYGYMVDVINKDTDDNDNGLVSATIPSISEGNLPTTVEETNVTLANVKYNTIVNDNKDIYEIWGNSDSTDKLFNTYKDWTKSMLDVKKYKPQVTLDIDNGGKKYNDFNVTFGKFAVVKDSKVGVAFDKDTNNKADGVFSLNIENGKVVKLVQKEGSNTKYYDSKYLALLIQIADDANISLAEADKMFDASDLQNSILEAIQSSTDSYNKSAKDDSEKAEEYLGNGTNWYDEKVKTIVIRRYVTDSVTPSGISLNDKIDYNVIGNQTNANDKNKHNAKWNFSFIFDVTDTDMKNKLSGSNVDGNKITVYGDQHVDGADFAIKNSSEDAGE